MLEQIWIYPVKGCRGIRRATANVERWGLEEDRLFAVTAPNGTLISQLHCPRLATIGTGLDQGRLTLSNPELGTVAIERLGAILSIEHQGRHLAGRDCGGEAADWLSCALGRQARLTRFEADTRDRHLLTEGLPVTAMCRASLDAVAGGSGLILDPGRFRANLLIRGGTAFDEDAWSDLEIGTIRFAGAGQRTLCGIINVDQRTGERGTEPLRTLARLRRKPGTSEVVLGINLSAVPPFGTIAVGEPITVLARQALPTRR